MLGGQGNKPQGGNTGNSGGNSGSGGWQQTLEQDGIQAAEQYAKNQGYMK
jgi:hypothetical protein